MNRVQSFGIGSADSSKLPAARGLYASAHPIWRLPWQVSGHFNSGTESLFLFVPARLHWGRNTLELLSSSLSRSNKSTSRVKVAIVCNDRMPQAGGWRICAPNATGHRRFWRPGFNVGDTTSAGKWWPKLNWACVGSAIYGLSASKRRLTFPSYNFFRRKFRMRIWTLPSLISQRNPGANAKS